MAREKLFTLTAKDFEIDTFIGSGPGGQHRNKTESAVRIRHRESGAEATAKSDRSQHVNKQNAFRVLTRSPKFMAWVRRRSVEMMDSRTLEQRVADDMAPGKIKVEVKDENGRWVEGEPRD